MFSYTKRGGIHFLKVGRFGFNFYVSRKPASLPPHIVAVLNRGLTDIVETIAYDRACERSVIVSRILGHS